MKLSGIEEGHSVHVLGQKEFPQVGQDRVKVPQVPLLGHGYTLDTNIGLVGVIGHEKANIRVTKPL